MNKVLKTFFVSLVAFVLYFSSTASFSVVKAENVQTQNTTSTSQKEQALRSANDYLTFMPFSKEGLIDQLLYEKYTRAEAEYAVNTVNANWKHQAARSAKNYLEIMPFSKKG